MNIMTMTKEDFKKVPVLDIYHKWEDISKDGKLEFKSFVIIPREGEMHDSGWTCMEFCLLNDDEEPIWRIGGGSDVINLDGIGGYGYKARENSNYLFGKVTTHGWNIDCLPCGYLRVFTYHQLFISSRFCCSNFEVYSEDKKKGG